MRNRYTDRGNLFFMLIKNRNTEKRTKYQFFVHVYPDRRLQSDRLSSASQAVSQEISYFTTIQ